MMHDLDTFGNTVLSFSEGAKVCFTGPDGRTNETVIDGNIRVNHSLPLDGFRERMVMTIVQTRPDTMVVQTRDGEEWSMTLLEPAPKIEEENEDAKKQWWHW
jgi:hypothetical protein